MFLNHINLKYKILAFITSAILCLTILFIAFKTSTKTKSIVVCKGNTEFVTIENRKVLNSAEGLNIENENMSSKDKIDEDIDVTDHFKSTLSDINSKTTENTRGITINLMNSPEIIITETKSPIEDVKTNDRVDTAHPFEAIVSVNKGETADNATKSTTSLSNISDTTSKTKNTNSDFESNENINAVTPKEAIASDTKIQTMENTSETATSFINIPQIISSDIEKNNIDNNEKIYLDSINSIQVEVPESETYNDNNTDATILDVKTPAEIRVLENEKKYKDNVTEKSINVLNPLHYTVPEKQMINTVNSIGVICSFNEAGISVENDTIDNSFESYETFVKTHIDKKISQNLLIHENSAIIKNKATNKKDIFYPINSTIVENMTNETIANNCDKLQRKEYNHSDDYLMKNNIIISFTYEWINLIINKYLYFARKNNIKLSLEELILYHLKLIISEKIQNVCELELASSKKTKMFKNISNNIDILDEKLHCSTKLVKRNLSSYKDFDCYLGKKRILCSFQLEKLLSNYKDNSIIEYMQIPLHPYLKTILAAFKIEMLQCENKINYKDMRFYMSNALNKKLLLKSLKPTNIPVCSLNEFKIPKKSHNGLGNYIRPKKNNKKLSRRDGENYQFIEFFKTHHFASIVLKTIKYSNLIFMCLDGTIKKHILELNKIIEEYEKDSIRSNTDFLQFIEIKKSSYFDINTSAQMLNNASNFSQIDLLLDEYEENAAMFLKNKNELKTQHYTITLLHDQLATLTSALSQKLMRNIHDSNFVSIINQLNNVTTGIINSNNDIHYILCEYDIIRSDIYTIINGMDSS